MRPPSLSLRPGEWGGPSRRVAVLGSGSGWAVLDQPRPPAENPPPGSDGLERLLRERQAEGTPSVCTLFPGSGVSAVFPLNGMGGAVPFAGDLRRLSSLREEYGSNRWTLRFYLLARGAPDRSELVCDLPVAVHRSEPLSLVSHRTGRKASTAFRRLLDGPGLSLWEARTSFLRPDQIRLHAAESGIRIAGESVYAREDPVSRSDLPGTRRPGGKGFVLLEGPAVHLAGLEIPSLDQRGFRSPLPKVMVKWISAHSGKEKDLQSRANWLF